MQPPTNLDPTNKPPPSCPIHATVRSAPPASSSSAAGHSSHLTLTPTFTHPVTHSHATIGLTPTQTNMAIVPPLLERARVEGLVKVH